MRLLAILVALAALAMPALAMPAQAAERLTVFAAASTTDAVSEVLARFTEATGAQAVASFAASSTLAKQIAAGAPADVVLSANVAWMDFLEEAAAIRPESRIDLLGNSLVLVTAEGSGFACDPAAGCDLAAALGGGRLAVGDPDHVPAGIYAKEALQSLGQWHDVESRLARASDVRAALALVARGETPAGIVYTTDAALFAGVEVAARLPADTHAPIVYPAAVVAASEHPAAADLMRFLAGPEARAIFVRHGFTVVAPPPPAG